MCLFYLWLGGLIFGVCFTQKLAVAFPPNFVEGRKHDMKKMHSALWKNNFYFEPDSMEGCAFVYNIAFSIISRLPAGCCLLVPYLRSGHSSEKQSKI